MSATPDNTLADPERLIANLQRQLAECRAERDEALAERDKAQGRLAERTAERDEALEQQTATAEVLQVINSSPGDLAPVFDAMLENVLRLCEADFGILQVREGNHFRTAALRGVPAALAEFLSGTPREPGKHTAVGRMLDGEDFVHFEDMTKEPAYQSGDSRQRAFVELGGTRTYVAVALRKDGRLLGSLAAYRQEVRPFTDKQIALLQNFAAQAVIAMENARLLTQTREALEQQTATAEVLQVINSSPGDLAPVFQSILEKAHSLCDSAHGTLFLCDSDGYFRPAVMRGVPPLLAEQLRRGFPGRHSPASQPLLAGEPFVHIHDMADVDHPMTRAAVQSGARTLLSIPLRKGDALLGMIVAARFEVRPFSDKQIALLQNFAAQAVIAMENARLITETREALERQTATAEVLQVINSSPGDLAPVFDTLLEKAMHLCEAAFGEFIVAEGERVRAVALWGAPAAFAEIRRRSAPPTPGSIMARVLAGEPVIHTLDAKDDELYRRGDPHGQVLVDLAGARTTLAVTLIKDGAVLGAIHIYRQEVRPFTDKQIALLQNFAAQAVLAMENARLLTETREALEQQTATAEVLQVINSSPGDPAPVFDAILEKAHRLCGASAGSLGIFEGETWRAVAQRGYGEPLASKLRQPARGSDNPLLQEVIDGAPLVHVADLGQLHHPIGYANVAAGIHTLLVVALRKDDALLGSISIARREVRPFAETEIATLENFAAQAVIAMENARLLGELRQRTRDLEESLEYQTATSDVLKVISRSTFDLQPILDTLVETGQRLCDSDNASLAIREGDVFRCLGTRSHDPAYDAFIRARTFAPGRERVAGRVALTGEVVHIPDITMDPDYRHPEAVTLGKLRTALGVPLLRDGSVVGTLTLNRKRVEPFSERQIELVRTFADQAVIAIENTRLLTELRESLEQQTATAEVLQVINSSPGELQPVFEAILEKARTRCGATRGVLYLFEGETFSGVAMQGVPRDLAEQLRRGIGVRQTSIFAPLLAGAPFVHVADNRLIDDPVTRAAAEHGARTYLLLALRKDGALLGVISCARGEVRPFSEKEIAFLENFAAQAVIAMDNARLLEEIRRRQAELRVTFDNMGDGVAMFDAELRLTAWNRNFQQILDLPDTLLAGRPSLADYIRHLATHGEYGEVDVEAEVRRLIEAASTQYSTERTRPDGRVIEVRANPVPGGGVVIIYSDITDRKSAEAEIRAARDAAEKALHDLQAAQASLLHAQKMAALGQLTAGIAHEIKNPLNFVNNFADLSVELLDELKETTEPAVASLGEDTRAEIDEIVGMLTANLGKIAEHGRRADGIVKSMLAHSRGGSDDWQPFGINALVEEALNLAYHGARAHDQNFNITMERDLAAGISPVELVPQDLTRVFLNLFGNGFYAADKRRREAADGFRPMVKVTTRDLGNEVEIRVRDNGTGILPEHRDKLFQPFFTTKPTGEGTGLGLSISWDIVTQQHRGTIAVDSRVGEFTEFTIRLPRSRRAA